jgi:hypothetical protein
MRISSLDKYEDAGPIEIEFRKKYMQTKKPSQINTEDNIDPTIPENREKIFECLLNTYEKIVSEEYKALDFDEFEVSEAKDGKQI